MESFEIEMIKHNLKNKSEKELEDLLKAFKSINDSGEEFRYVLKNFNEVHDLIYDAMIG